jgi:hypothetical protein
MEQFLAEKCCPGWFAFYRCSLLNCSEFAMQDKVALYCARNFTKNPNMVTVSMNRIFFKLPITMDDIVTMHARVCSARYVN